MEIDADSRSTPTFALLLFTFLFSPFSPKLVFSFHLIFTQFSFSPHFSPTFAFQVLVFPFFTFCCTLPFMFFHFSFCTYGFVSIPILHSTSARN